MRGYEAAQILKEKGITVEDVAEEITYRKETNAFSNNPKNEAFMNMTLNELVRIKAVSYTHLLLRCLAFHQKFVTSQTN